MNSITFFDLSVLDFINEHLRNKFFDVLMTSITFLGNSIGIWFILALVLLFIPKCKKCGILMIIGILLGFLFCNIILKPLVARTRPFDIVDTIEIIIKKPLDYSFPSGHTVSAFISSVIIYTQHKKAGIFAIIFASLMAFSRLYLYVHYPSDVIAGILLGITIAIFTVKLYEYISAKYTASRT